MKLVLASASPRRIGLISKLGYEVSVCPANIEERTTETEPDKIVMDLSRQKASAVKSDELVLGADTIVYIDGKVLGKPHSEAEAYEMLRKIMGRTHVVWTGICLKKGDKIVSTAEKSEVVFAPYDEEIIKKYIASGKPFDKAGAYGLQDEEVQPLLKEVIGDYDNVLGLPVKRVEELILENFT